MYLVNGTYLYLSIHMYTEVCNDNNYFWENILISNAYIYFDINCLFLDQNVYHCYL